MIFCLWNLQRYVLFCIYVFILKKNFLKIIKILNSYLKKKLALFSTKRSITPLTEKHSSSSAMLAYVLFFCILKLWSLVINVYPHAHYTFLVFFSPLIIDKRMFTIWKIYFLNIFFTFLSISKSQSLDHLQSYIKKKKNLVDTFYFVTTTTKKKTTLCLKKKLLKFTISEKIYLVFSAVLNFHYCGTW